MADETGTADGGFDLTGRRVLVTGASSGIGAAVAARLARAGATVVAVSRSGRVPHQPAGILALAADLGDEAELDRVADRAAEALGGLDVVVNNAGRSDWRLLADTDRAHFDALVGLNLWAPLRLSERAHRYLRASPDAVVVMVGSVDATRPSAGAAVYGATKAALAAATVALAKEWATDGIRVVQVDPGLVATPMTAAVVDELDASGTSINLVGRPGAPGEVAGLVHYLVSPLGRFANATSFRIDGGALALGPFDRWATERA